MKRLLLLCGAAGVALTLVGLVGGDPRAASELAHTDAVVLAGLAVALGVAALAWWAGRARRLLVLMPTAVLTVIGGLCGWIAAAEFTLQPDVPVQLAERPLRATFMIALTALGMALPALGWTALAGRGRGRGRDARPATA